MSGKQLSKGVLVFVLLVAGASLLPAQSVSGSTSGLNSNLLKGLKEFAEASKKNVQVNTGVRTPSTTR